LKVLRKEDIPALVDSLTSKYGRVFAPIRKENDQLLYDEIGRGQIDLDGGLPQNSLKEILTPFLQLKLFELKGKGKHTPVSPVALFGVRSCDLNAIKMVDHEYAELIDCSDYLAENGLSLIVSVACASPEDTCFCREAGGGPFLYSGFDLQLYDAGRKFLVEVGSNRGRELVHSLPEIFSGKRADIAAEIGMFKSRALSWEHRQPNLQEAMKLLLEGRATSRMWRLEGNACDGCGTCFDNCPTCLCLCDDDIPEVTGQYCSDLCRLLEKDCRTLNLNESEEEFVNVDFFESKLRQSKLTGFPACVGCGRCARNCHKNEGMAVFIDRLTGEDVEVDKYESKKSDQEKTWMNRYGNRIVKPGAAFKEIRRGDSIFIASGCAEPQFLVSELLKNAGRMADVQAIHLLNMGHSRIDDPKLEDHIRLNAFFIGEGTRAAIAEGRADYTPIYLSEIPELIRREQIRVDVALVQVSPPDEYGYCSLGISVETIKAATEKARFVIAQVNPKMPRTHGDSFIHIEQLHALIPQTEDLIEWPLPIPNEVSRKIAKNVLRLIEDGATLQLGIGRISHALLPLLESRRDIGLHTVVISEDFIDLFSRGAVTNRFKRLHSGKTITTFAVGSRRLYEYVHNNPAIEFHPTDYVCNPKTISKNYKMTTVNTALEVDLTGQVAADTIGRQFYGGLATQVDFIRGAITAQKGKTIVALPSTAAGGTISRITSDLSAGSGITATRGDIHYVVTEYGIAFLHGRTIRERSLSLIEIAHPKFRAELLEKAKEMNLIYLDQGLPSLTEHVYPEQWESTITTSSGEKLFIRPVKASDERRLQELFYSLPDKDVYLRFVGNNPNFPHRRMQSMTIVDYEDRMAIVAAIGPVGNRSIIGVARFDRHKDSDTAEVAFTVRNDYRRKGVGTHLLKHLTRIAITKGIRGFQAEILSENKAMMRLFHTSGCKTSSSIEDRMYSCWYKFDEPDEQDK
jgi:acyl-CoA hydrolase/RimJ/RimL family protein N-acetyltransferase